MEWDWVEEVGACKHCSGQAHAMELYAYEELCQALEQVLGE